MKVTITEYILPNGKKVPHVEEIDDSMTALAACKLSMEVLRTGEEVYYAELAVTKHGEPIEELVIRRPGMFFRDVIRELNEKVLSHQ